MKIHISAIYYKAKTFFLLACFFCVINARAGTWDATFNASFYDDVESYFSPFESAQCVATLGGEIYVGTIYNQAGSSGEAHVYRYEESTGIWESIASFGSPSEGPTSVLALSAVTQGNGTKYLFVGGAFSSVTYGTNSSAVSNVVVLCVSGNSTNIGKLGSSTVYGTSGPVYTLKAFSSSDIYAGSQYPGVQCIVGGKFATAGSITNANSIALWKQNSTAGTYWSGFDGGFSSDGYGNLGKVYSVDAIVGGGVYGQTVLSTMWVGGALSRNIGGNTAQHGARWDGVNGTWQYLGKLFGRYNPTIGDVEPYGSFYATSTCLAGNQVYYGGFCTHHKTGYGSIVGDGTFNPSLIRFSTTYSYYMYYYSDVYNIKTLCKKGSDLYASGYLYDDPIDGHPVWNGKRGPTSWTELASGGPEQAATSIASNSTYLYFVAGSVYRYLP